MNGKNIHCWILLKSSGGELEIVSKDGNEIVVKIRIPVVQPGQAEVQKQGLKEDSQSSVVV